MTRFFSLLSVFILIILWGCYDESESIKSHEPFLPNVPPNLGTSIPFPERNPFTESGILLGRKLFYDPILSGSNRISCATCHLQNNAFTDGISLSSQGVSGKHLLRNAPTLTNIAWSPRLFWDGGASDLESQAFAPLENKDEMDQDLNVLLDELRTQSDYSRLFKAAFQSDTITTARIVRALAQFERTIISGNSKYDKFIRNEAGGELSEIELKGLALFKKKCSSCHKSDHFTDYDYHNNGLDSLFPDDNIRIAWGRARITESNEDIGKFKTPTLRNVALTFPYMHDGRFNTLEGVMEHYNSGIKNSKTIDPIFKNINGSIEIKLSEKEQDQIIQFLNTLTDMEFINNSELADKK